MKKICCLLALTILAGRPAFADDTPAAPSEKHNIVLGQAEKKTAQDAADKKARDAQALFEESLRQMMPLDEGQISGIPVAARTSVTAPCCPCLQH